MLTFLWHINSLPLSEIVDEQLEPELKELAISNKLHLQPDSHEVINQFIQLMRP